jgi:DNA polymerase III subunit epsilon
MADFVTIDFETANESYNSACSVGVTVVADGRVADCFYSLIRPPEPVVFNSVNSAIHKLSEADILAAPSFCEIWKTLSPYLENQIVVAHNAPFDFGVLQQSLRHFEIPPPHLKCVCSLKLSELVWPDLNQHKLGFLAHWLNIPLNQHNAKSDSIATAEIVLHAMRAIDADTVTDLIEQIIVEFGIIDSTYNFRPPVSRLETNRKLKRDFLISSFSPGSHPFFGMKIVITGDLPTISKDEAFGLIESVGGEKQKNVTKQTDILVSGYNDPKVLASGEVESRNLQKARKLIEKGHAIAIITPEEFMQSFLFDPHEDSEPTSGETVAEPVDSGMSLPVVDLNEIHSIDNAVISWITRTYEENESWKKKARNVFFAVSGNHDLSRCRLAGNIREYFLALDLPFEDISKWSQDRSTIEKIRIIPPVVSGSRQQFINWAKVADYLLLCCAVASDEIEDENSLRVAEHRIAAQSFKVLCSVNAARAIIREMPLLQNEDVLELLKQSDSGAAIAYVKEARRREKAGLPIEEPVKPNDPILIDRYKPVYF